MVGAGAFGAVGIAVGLAALIANLIIHKDEPAPWVKMAAEFIKRYGMLGVNIDKAQLEVAINDKYPVYENPNGS